MRIFNILKPSAWLRSVYLCWLLLLGCLHPVVWANDPNASPDTVKLDKPVAYCLAPLAECSPDKYMAFQDAVPGDLRALNGGTQDPVTLVYKLPAFLANKSPNASYSVMVAGSYRDYCFRFDGDSLGEVCSQKKLTRTPIPAHASHFLIQQLKGVDTRIFRPNLIIGTHDALEQRRLNDVYPVLFLSGCYAFLTLISLAQLFTQRNQIASLALSCFALAMLCRTVVVSAYDFSGLPLPAPDLMRKLEIMTLCAICFFAVEFYGQLIGNRLLRLRRIFQGVGCLIAVSVLLSVNPAHAFYNLRVSQVYGLLALVLVIVQILLSIKTFIRRERFVLLIGFCTTALGVSLDLYFSFQNIAGVPHFFVYCFAFESLCQFVLLAFRNDNAHVQAEQLAVQLQASRDEIAQKNEALKELDRMKDQFIATVSHELRTPIHGLTHMTEVLLRSPDLPASLQKPLHAWTDASARLSQLVGNIIDFSDMQQGQLRVSLQDVDPLPLLQQQIDAAQLALKGKPITVRSRLPSDVALLHADPLRVIQILNQIVGNAIKFTKAGEIEIICQRARNKTPDMVEIIVTDTGNGMSGEQLATITRTFAQGDASDKRLTGGTGLGLSLTHRLAHAMGGSLHIESTPGIGTIVRVSLPASSTPRSVPELSTFPAPPGGADPATSPTQTPPTHETAVPEQRRASDPVTAPSASTPPLALIGQSIALSTSDGPPRILIVDDDPTNRMVLREQLSSQGYELADAVDGIDGLEKFQSEGPFDCVLLDVMMPRMNGLDACKQLRLSYSKTDLPVFMLSAKVQTKDIVAGFDAGANDYLPKPFSKTELLARLDTHIGVARTGRAMGRFVPRPFMDLLGRQHVTEVVLGDCVQMPMAVLFSDFRGFTTVAEGKTAPQLFALLNQFYTQIAPLVRWHGGFVDKYVGDGMMALFPGGAQDALAAAQAMVQAVQTISTEHGMAMGMGIHCGSTMLGTLGEPQRFDTTVISDVVNSASRLEGASKQLGADIVVSQAVLDAVSTDTPLQIRRLGKLRLKGKNEVLEVAEVLTALENSAHRQAKWQQRAVFEQAVLDCAEGRYAQARVSLGQLCKQCPTDLAAQLYLEAAIQADEGQPAQVFDRGALILKEK